MERTILLEHYRLSLGFDGMPKELGRDGAAIVYEGVDERSREAVAVTVVPIKSIDPALRDRFEDLARAVQRLRHANIAKVFEFTRDGEDYVYVSEQPVGETLAAWVAQHGPMPADATLRVAEQIVSVFSSASFHKLPYPPIDLSQIFIVPGQTPEGGWPLIKLTNFGVTGLQAGVENERETPGASLSGPTEPETKDAPLVDAPTATVKSLTAESRKATGEQPSTDVRWEIYSLGATMYFLLTGVALSAEAVRRSPKLSGFPKPLRGLLSRMLHPNPDRRPKDLVVLAEMIRKCLVATEHRFALADRYGIPVRTTVPRPSEPSQRRWLRPALAFGAVVLAAAIGVAVLFPTAVGGIFHRPREMESIGVLVGVPQPSVTPAANQSASTPVAPTTVLSQAANSTLALANQPAADGTTPSDASPAPATDPQHQPSSPQPQEAASPDAVAAAPPATVPETSRDGEPATTSPTDTESSSSTTQSQSSSRATKKGATASSRRRSVRVRMIGITSDGRLIYRLPSGRTRIVAPDSNDDQLVPRRHRRSAIQRDQTFARPPEFGPDYSPYD
ncbi:MAG TPA: hypothetical protein VFA51_04620 [Candidatus Udaeobacter sp.]|nr:hypothetical protein [Candidatus Udaeobacter sp.]